MSHMPSHRTDPDKPGPQRFEVGARMSQAVLVNGCVHVAGQIADTRKGSITVQTAEVLAKIEALIGQAGATKADLVAINVFLPHITDFDAMNAVYDRWIDPAHPPARACVEARLADPDLRVEMTAIAVVR